jgi:hypothetical protein
MDPSENPQYIRMHVSCTEVVKVDASLSHLIASLLKPFVSHAENFSTLLPSAYMFLDLACRVSHALAYAYS